MKNSKIIINKATFILLLSSFIFTSTSIAFAEVKTAETLKVAAIDKDKAAIYNDSKDKKGKDEEEPDCE